MPRHDQGTGYTRVEATLQKWEQHRTPEDGEPDETLVSVHWTDPEGNEVTDEATIAALAARYQQTHTHEEG